MKKHLRGRNNEKTKKKTPPAKQRLATSCDRLSAHILSGKRKEVKRELETAARLHRQIADEVNELSKIVRGVRA